MVANFTYLQSMDYRFLNVHLFTMGSSYKWQDLLKRETSLKYPYKGEQNKHKSRVYQHCLSVILNKMILFLFKIFLNKLRTVLSLISSSPTLFLFYGLLQLFFIQFKICIVTKISQSTFIWPWWYYLLLLLVYFSNIYLVVNIVYRFQDTITFNIF